jgi:hypothetical protein
MSAVAAGLARFYRSPAEIEGALISGNILNVLQGQQGQPGHGSVGLR